MSEEENKQLSPEEAEAIAQEMREKFPGLDLLLFRIEHTAMSQYFSTDEAKELVKRIRFKKPFFDFRRDISEIFNDPDFEELNKAFTEGNYELLTQELKAKVERPVFEFIRATCWYKEGQYKRALVILDNLIAHEYFHHNIFSLKASIYLKMEKPVEAEINCILAIMASMGHPNTFLNYAFMLIKQQDLNGAKYAFKQVLLRVPDNLSAVQNLGVLMRQEIIQKLAEHDSKLKDKLKMSGHAQIRTLNNVTRGLWFNSYTMRKGISDLLSEYKDASSICIVGAGNCNNFDLNQYAKRYKKIKLVDIDKYALGYARRIQNLKKHKHITFKFGIDVTDVIDDMYFWSKDCPSTDEVEMVIRKASLAPMHWKQEYDLIVSDCVLQSVLHYVNAKLGMTHPDFNHLYGIIIMRHVEMLVDSVNPGGKAILLTEIMSSEQQDPLRKPDSAECKEIIENIGAHTGRLLTHLNPYTIQDLISQNKKLCERISKIELTKPWFWFYPGINYLVAALIFTRRS